MEALRRNLATLESEYAQFDELDWGASASKIQRLTEERDRLVAASDVLRQLKEQLDRAEAMLGKTDKDLERAKEERAKTAQRRTDTRNLFASTEAEQRAARVPTETQSQALDACAPTRWASTDLRWSPATIGSRMCANGCKSASMPMRNA